MARLVGTEGTLTGRTFEIDPGLTLGREGHNDIGMPANRHASRDHAKVWKDGVASWAVADLGSTNGTFVNDDKVMRRPLKDGDLIRIGDETFRFELGEEDRPKPKAKPVEEKPDLAAVLRGEVKPKPVATGLGAVGADALQVKQRVLQYRKKGARGSPLTVDYGQLAGLRKWLVIVFAIGVLVAIFLLSKGVTERARPPLPELPPTGR